ncbi:GlxA family transcriptional regulator [Nocardioides speluncae]|uniref:GlxA family transcriptional regulator n=1 Tax=Nocardioides speluncae TaxID=2670337 RepID=UPI000D69FECC|nr:DJ-1/PfpI family protein [Nocardioides speluncae]
MTRVLFVLPPGVHLLDLSGPAQAFGSVWDCGPVYELSYVATEPLVTSHQGLGLVADTTWPSLAADDLVVIPGWENGDGPIGQPVAEPLLEEVVRHHEAGGTMLSVCAGAFALAATGLLDGRRATTHHGLQDALQRRHPRVRVVRDVLFVSEDRLHTSAGIASGIDLALHVISERHGPATAARVARSMVVYARRNGLHPQQSVMLRHRDHLDDIVHRTQDEIDERYAEPLPLAELAAGVAVSERTLTRAFTSAVGLTPLRYQQQVRLERAELLIGAGTIVEAAARAVGFEDARMLRRLRAR